MRFRAVCFIHESLGLTVVPREMNPASGQLHDDQEIKGDQTVFGPNLDCREIDGGQYIPMSLEERLPGGLSLR